MLVRLNALRSSAAVGSLARSSVNSAPYSKRALHVSKINNDAAHGTGAHAEEEHEHYPSEGFGAPIWRYTFLTGVGVAAWYRYSSTQSSGQHGEEDEEANKPFLTRYIEYNMPKQAVWEGRNARHLEAVRQNAEDRILFSTAERPPIRRSRYNVDGNGSVSRLAVGDSVDMSSPSSNESE